MNEHALLIDLEQQAFFAALPDPEEGQSFVPAGKMIAPLVKPGSGEARLLEEIGGLYSCDDRSPGDFPFYPVPALILLAEDETGTVYGLIGGCDESAPVGFVTLEGAFGQAAGNLADFLRMVAFCPDWQRALRKGLPLPGPVFSPERQQLASLLSLHWEEMTAGRLGWREPPGFQLYASRQQAAEQWRFTDDDFWKRG